MAIRAGKAESELASRAKSAFLGTMSHELRTPLNSIIGFSDLIAALDFDASSAGEAKSYAAQIAASGRHMLAVVSDILDITKIESGTFELNVGDYPVDEIVESSLPLVRARIDEKRQKLQLKLHPGLPTLPLDPRRIKQILVNLLSNASKFTPEGGRIRVVARPNRDGGATIAVIDSGCGMSESEIATAFEPFGQVDQSRTRRQEGTGLGLPIARGLARQHGADLYLESEPDVGTTAVLTLRKEIPLDWRRPPPPAPIGGGERRTPRKPAHSRGAAKL